MLSITEITTFITAISPLGSVVIVVFGGVFAFIKWLDTRNRGLKEERYSKYMGLLGIIAGRMPDGSKARMTDQIAAVWFLLEYKEYKDMTYRIFVNSDLSDIAEGAWVKHVAPQIKLLLNEIKP